MKNTFYMNQSGTLSNYNEYLDYDKDDFNTIN